MIIIRPEISIIVPVYKVEQYLARCIDSILAQSFTDFELILVDDGSPDGCPAICDEYAAKDERIHVIHKGNGGVSSARNAGLDAAKGEYISFCDADDYWESSWLESLYTSISSKNADCVSACYTLVDEDGLTLEIRSRSSGDYYFVTCEDKTKFIATKIICNALGWEVCVRLFRSEIIRQKHIRFCEKCENFAEDMGFVLEYTLCSASAVCIANSGYYYVQRNDSMMHKSVEEVKLNSMNEISLQVGKRFFSIVGEDVAKSQFPIVHFLIMNCQYCKITNSPHYPYLGREIKKIQNEHWYFRQTKGAFRCYAKLRQFFGKNHANQILLLSNYCIHGNWKRFKLESALYYKVIAKL